MNLLSLIFIKLIIFTRYFKRIDRKFIIIVVIILVFLFETFSFSAIYIIGKFAPQYRLDIFINKIFDSVDERYLNDYRSKAYDELLGWDNKPSTKRTFKNFIDKNWTSSYGNDGARLTGFEDKELLIASYGDSFVHGDEVSDDLTWQHFLGKIFNQQVKNFGVGGYGTDQALLKFKRHVNKGLIAPFTILGIHESDVGRITSNYRPFINPSVGLKLGFKPAYRYQKGEVKYVANPFQLWMSPKDLKNLAIKLSKDDPALDRRAYIKQEFPYSLQSIKLARYFSKKFINRIRKIDNADPWTYPQEIALMNFIVDDFLRTSCQHNSIPILLFIPDTQNWQNGRKAPKYLKFKENIHFSRYQALIIVDMYEINFYEDIFNLYPFRAHLSPYGNKVIADSIAKRLGPIIKNNVGNFEEKISNYCNKLPIQKIISSQNFVSSYL